jgi:hypothetical protein
MLARVRLFQFVIAAPTLALCLALFNFAVDPLQFFHAAKFYSPKYMSEVRNQGAGLIHSEAFNLVFMGTSLAVHYRPSMIDRYLGTKSLKLAMSGSNSVEQSFVLRAALARHPQTVLWEMDDWIFRDAPAIDQDPYINAELYRRNVRGIAQYLLSLDTARESLWLLLRSLKPLKQLGLELTWTGYLKYTDDSVDDINSWPTYLDYHGTYSTDRAWNSFSHYRQYPYELSAGYDYAAMVKNFDRDALALVKEHPETKFIVYFPPYSILQSVVMRRFAPQTYEIFERISQHMLTSLAGLPNVELFDFRDFEEISHNLDNYADVAHHSPYVDEQVLKLISKGLHRVDPNDPAASIKTLTRQVDDYQIGSH